MAFMNGGFRWTVIIALALGTWLAGTVATLQLREMSDRKLAAEAAFKVISDHDSMVTAISDSLFSNQAQIMAGIEILQERGYRLYSRQLMLKDKVGRLEEDEKPHARVEIDRDERRR